MSRTKRPRRVAVTALSVVLGVGGAVAVGLFAVPHIRALRASATADPKSFSLDPSAFAAGACVSLAPTATPNGKVVFLDAGHGGVDPGGVGTTESGQSVAESGVNLQVELDAASLLRAAGYRVVVSRTKDLSVLKLTSADLDEGVLSVQGVHDVVVARDRCANLARVDALVGIYMDSSGSSQVAGSVSPYDDARPFSGEDHELATLLQSEVLAALDSQGWQIPDDGVDSDDGYGSSVGDPSSGGLAAAAASYDHLMLLGPAMTGYFTTPSEMPGAVVEPLYLTDPFEGSLAANSSGQQEIAKGIANAVAQFVAPSKSRSN